MAIFEDVTLTFKGKEFTVPADQVMRLISKIYDCIELHELISKKGPRHDRLAQAYTAALNHAGAKVTLEEVYTSLFGKGGREAIAIATAGLLYMLVPPEHYRPTESGNALPPTPEDKET